jgi:hypothetical protein
MSTSGPESADEEKVNAAEEQKRRAALARWVAWVPVVAISFLALVGEWRGPESVLRFGIAGFVAVAVSLVVLSQQPGFWWPFGLVMALMAVAIVANLTLESGRVLAWVRNVTGPQPVSTDPVLNLSDRRIRPSDLQGRVLAGGIFDGSTFVALRAGGADLRGASLQRAVLVDADLRGAHLQGVDLAGANLTGAHLEGADLRGADLHDACLRGSYLRGTVLTEARTDGSDWTDADLGHAVVAPSNSTRVQTNLATDFPTASPTTASESCTLR